MFPIGDDDNTQGGLPLASAEMKPSVIAARKMRILSHCRPPVVFSLDA